MDRFKEWYDEWLYDEWEEQASKEAEKYLDSIEQERS